MDISMFGWPFFTSSTLSYFFFSFSSKKTIVICFCLSLFFFHRLLWMHEQCQRDIFFKKTSSFERDAERSRERLGLMLGLTFFVDCWPLLLSTTTTYMHFSFLSFLLSHFFSLGGCSSASSSSFFLSSVHNSPTMG